MLRNIKQVAKRFVSKYSSQEVPLKWILKNSNSLLSQHIIGDSIKPKNTVYSSKIEKIAQATNLSGLQPLWNGYAGFNLYGPSRMPDDVSTSATMGNLYIYLVQKLQPHFIVEFGTAFGVSGMYFLAGIESNNTGQLLTFEPNDIWRKMAISNLSQISDRFNSIAGTFEEHIDDVLPKGQSIDLSFIDAIHTKEFVIPQLEIVMARSKNHAIIILDDINFSDSMRDCWKEVSKDTRFSSSVELGETVGILELN